MEVQGSIPSLIHLLWGKGLKAVKFELKEKLSKSSTRIYLFIYTLNHFLLKRGDKFST